MNHDNNDYDHTVAHGLPIGGLEGALELCSLQAEL
jgi:hypothetical protein